MHIILATMGTDGDVFPYLGLGSALLKRGHRVTIAAPETYQDRAIELGMEFESLVSTADVQRMLSNPDLWDPFRSGPMMAKWGNPMIPYQYELLARLASEPDSVMVANPGVVAARLVQEKLHCPTASLLLQPGVLPSCTAPPAMPGGMNIPTWFPYPLRKLYWRAVDFAGYLLVARSLNRFRAKLGLSPIRRFFRWWLSPDLVIGMFPEWYATPQPDWPRQLRLVGFGRFDGVRLELPDDIRKFCEAGTPPIVFTLGTGMMHAAEFFREAVAACESIRARGLLLTKYPDVIPNELPPTIIHYPFAPFRELLPRCGAIVHHGGIGTTAAALEAGCPQLVMPLAWDQPDNGARIKKLGVGTVLNSRYRKSLHLSRAVVELTTPETRDRCQRVSSLAKNQNGQELAVELIEEMGRRHRT